MMIESVQVQLPETLWFFGHIAKLESRIRFQSRIAQITPEDEIKMLGSQIFILSKNVLIKHKWVNRGFLLFGISLLQLLALAASISLRGIT